LDGSVSPAWAGLGIGIVLAGAPGRAGDSWLLIKGLET